MHNANASRRADPFTVDLYRWYVIVLLLLVYSVNFLDRQVINILAESIKHELKISDTQLGLLTGTAFGLFYSLLGLPIARLADRTNRVRLIGAALFLWSGLTSACGLALSYAQLFALRLGVGVGEAGCTPPAQSLISDYFPHQQRSVPMAIYNMGVPLGSFMGFLLGGVVNQIWGWRVALAIAGAPGIILTLLVLLTIKEPVRGAVEGLQNRRQIALSQTLAALFTRKSFIWVVLGGTFGIFIVFVANAWLPPLFLRLHRMNSSQVGAWIAICTGVGGTIGVMGGGYVSDQVKRRFPNAEALVPATTTALAFPLLLFTSWARSDSAALAGMFFLFIFAYAWLGPTSAMIQRSAPVHSRAMATGIQLSIANIFALAMGPPLVGLISDSLHATMGQESIRAALGYVSVAGLLGAACFAIAQRYLAEDAKLNEIDRNK